MQVHTPENLGIKKQLSSRQTEGGKTSTGKRRRASAATPEFRCIYTSRESNKTGGAVTPSYTWREKARNLSTGRRMNYDREALILLLFFLFYTNISKSKDEFAVYGGLEEGSGEFVGHVVCLEKKLFSRRSLDSGRLHRECDPRAKHVLRCRVRTPELERS